MKPEEYRKQVEKEVEEARAQMKARTRSKPRANDPESRKAAIEAMGPEIIDDDDVFEKMMADVADTSVPATVRGAIVNTMHARSFASPKTAERRPEWLAGLRGLLADKDASLRERAAGLLMNEKDTHAQDVLLQGLRDPQKAIVPAERALELLGNDIHADVFVHARSVLQNPPNEAARLEAIRVLAAEPESVPLLESLLRDRKENPEVRRLAIAGLSATAPLALRKHASAIIHDDAEDPSIVATSLTALALDKSAPPGDLAERADHLRRKGDHAVRSAAKRLRSKLG